MSLDPRLLAVLACPEDKGPLYYFEDEDGMEREEWLWHCQWRARMRRYRIGDALPSGLGSVAGALDTVSGLVAH